MSIQSGQADSFMFLSSVEEDDEEELKCLEMPLFLMQAAKRSSVSPLSFVEILAPCSYLNLVLSFVFGIFQPP